MKKRKKKSIKLNGVRKTKDGRNWEEDQNEGKRRGKNNEVGKRRARGWRCRRKVNNKERECKHETKEEGKNKSNNRR